ncbi:TetR/AcrR family transcriptional regulator [Smaragdicoccus niigatensis]|uniref:TetR/AcrR family transcriptional regulator n=1 Tax=Smaragdicoccus niigatensis TaxID=359359 RepID=UPI00035D549E|nr:TetR/AcrR family transcriptional regulator [Smaragdicoccus niigatensis]
MSDAVENVAAAQGTVRERVLAAAIDELTEVGPERASLRSIARRVGITHQGIAHYFPDRTALFTQSAVDGLEKLHELSKSAVDSAGPDVPAGTSVARLGEAYVRFARAEPARFSLMYGSGLVDSNARALVDARRRLWRLVLSAVSAECDRGWGSGAEPLVLAIACWSSAHGLATLERVEGRVLPSTLPPEDVLALITRAIG